MHACALAHPSQLRTPLPLAPLPSPLSRYTGRNAGCSAPLQYHTAAPAPMPAPPSCTMMPPAADATGPQPSDLSETPRGTGTRDPPVCCLSGELRCVALRPAEGRSKRRRQRRKSSTLIRGQIRMQCRPVVAGQSSHHLFIPIIPTPR